MKRGEWLFRYGQIQDITGIYFNREIVYSRNICCSILLLCGVCYSVRINVAILCSC